ncbi:ABC transporter permease [Thermicanus aegyptius]|uniref:ABC transporter permease n=1 Tax=Thermicanus aegyptius TaxID=94009 RepID=UPI000413D00B|nr:ABC transporter permease [Thermicanus aegyptius]
MRIYAIVVRILRQFWHDKRSLALMFLAPMLILWMLYLVFNGDTYVPKIGVVDLPDQILDPFVKEEANITSYTFDEGEKALENQKIDALFFMEGSTLHVKLEGSNPSKNQAVLLLVQKGMEDLKTTLAEKLPKGNPLSSQPSLNLTPPVISYLYGSEDMKSFDNFGPVLLGFFSFFFVFLLSGIAFLKERTSGTLERLLATPIKRWEIVVGYVLGFGIFTTLQATLITWFAVIVLKMMMVGSFWYLLLTVLLLAMTALTLGTFLSAFANTEFQMIQFIPLVIVPQVFFSGLFDLDNMVEWMRKLSVVMPLTYGADALRDVMIRGKGWEAISVDLLILFTLSLFFILANIFALRKHRKI